MSVSQQLVWQCAYIDLVISVRSGVLMSVSQQQLVWQCAYSDLVISVRVLHLFHNN